MSTELTVVKPGEFAVVAADIGQVIKSNLGGEAISPADLIRIRVPAGGSTTWEVPTPNGDTESLKAVDAVVVHVARRRAYWPNATPTGEPPACASADCVTGVGEPGGACDKCPHNAFGSAHKGDGTSGRGKACKESKLLFILRDGHRLPEVVVVPPGSLRPMRRYQLNLERPYWSYVTRLELNRVHNKDGIAYAEVQPSQAGNLNEEQVAAVSRYAQEMSAVFGQVTVDRSEVEETTEV